MTTVRRLVRNLAAGAKDGGAAVLSAIGRSAPAASKNLLCLGGLAAIDHGFWIMWRPGGEILGGCMLFYIGLMIDKATDNANRPR